MKKQILYNRQMTENLLTSSKVMDEWNRSTDESTFFQVNQNFYVKKGSILAKIPF